MIITIDGPTASGKSTAARLLAEELGFYYIASGLFYRALAYLLITKAQYKVADLYHPKTHDIGNFLDPKKLIYTYDNIHREQVSYDGVILTPYLKTKELDQASSMVSTNPQVRDYFLKVQRNIAQTNNIVIDSRDAGSIVFPHAEFKFYVTAAIDIRSKRWQKDQEKKGIKISLDEAQQELITRDKRDMEREYAPLIVPKDAVIIDSSSMNPQELVGVMKEHIFMKR